MKILFVTNHFLDGNGGGCFASRAYINAFAEIAEECILLYPENRKCIDEYISPKIIKYPILNRTSNIGKLINIYRGRINRFYNIIFDIIKSFNPDIIVFDNSKSSAGYLESIKALGIKVITIHHNYEMEYYAGTKPSILLRHAFRYYLQKAEKVAVQKSDLNLTLTQQDINLLRQHYVTKNNVSFACIGVFEYKKSEDSNTILINNKHKNQLHFSITGSLNSKQTEVSLIPFLKFYYPLILKNYPNSKLIIAGKNPSSAIRNICASHESIELIANPICISEVINKTDIYICPTSVGGGLKLRIMDGLKLGLPVLTHEVSARGYDDFRNKDYLFAYNNQTTFEKQLKSIVHKSILHQNIRQFYYEQFSFENGLERLNKIMKIHHFIN